MGFQMAIEYNPRLARQLGNVHTAVELENLNSFYRQKLADIEKQMAIYQSQINELEVSNQKIKSVLDIKKLPISAEKGIEITIKSFK